MAVCATCRQPGITPGEHACPGPQYEDVVFTRHRGHAITVDTAPERTRISLHALLDRYAYLHMPDEQTIVFADQVVYRITGYDAGTLELELVEDWRPAPGIQLPLTDEEAAEIKAKWKEQHGNAHAVHPVVVLNQEDQP
ncbi:hypothetical protein [Streptomyces sp. NPDC102476]|jgi:hypothetical protein|uniref:hypothetical protein n=1 Tax=Streptomyces sp. NPDC102476 TaxID=3366181 RepID=UPI00381B4354